MKLLYVVPIAHVHEGLHQKIVGQVAAFETRFQTTVLPLKRFLPKVTLLWPFGILWYQFMIPLYAMSQSVVYIRYNPKLVFMNVFFALLSILKPIVFELNSNYDKELSKLNRPIELFFHKLQMSLLSFFPIHLLVVHQQYASRLKKKGFGSVNHLLNGYTPLKEVTDKPNAGVIHKVEAFKRLHVDCRIGIFVGSGATWHGADKLSFLLKTTPSIAIVLIGDYPDITSSERLLKLPPQSAKTVQNIYPLCHFGIGSLNWSEIGITEGTPLKTCEYLYHGLPILVNYHDWNNRFNLFKGRIFDLSKDDDALDRLLMQPLSVDVDNPNCHKALSWTKRLLPHIQTILTQ